MLISIQSLIFVDEPYFNEPGYEGTMHTPAGDKASRDYNRDIRYGRINYMVVSQSTQNSVQAIACEVLSVLPLHGHAACMLLHWHL